MLYCQLAFKRAMQYRTIILSKHSGKLWKLLFTSGSRNLVSMKLSKLLRLFVSHCSLAFVPPLYRSVFSWGGATPRSYSLCSHVYVRSFRPAHIITVTLLCNKLACKKRRPKQLRSQNVRFLISLIWIYALQIQMKLLAGLFRCSPPLSGELVEVGCLQSVLYLAVKCLIFFAVRTCGWESTISTGQAHKQWLFFFKRKYKNGWTEIIKLMHERMHKIS